MTKTTVKTPAKAVTKNAFDYFEPAPGPLFPLLERGVSESTLMSTLALALSVRRGHDGMGEARFVAQLANRLPVTLIDGAGNLHVDLRGSASRTLFTAHTDTVHHTEGNNVIRLDNQTSPGIEFWRADGAPLGADDGAGIALMCHMIYRNVPGYYVFFRAEECGGIGSSWLAGNMPELFKDFDRAIAFDRAGYHDVITKQAGGVCASDGFAQALADQLNALETTFLYCPDSTGVYTDTAEFTHLVPECTNLSVGYFAQHGPGEHQNVTHLKRLAAALVQVQWETLPTLRSPARKVNRGYAPIGDNPFGRIPSQSTNPLRDYTDSVGARGYALDEDDEDEQAFQLGMACSERAMSVLADALEGDMLGLVQMMSEEAAQCYDIPEDEAMRYIRTSGLRKLQLENAYDEIEAGEDASFVLLTLFDGATK